MNKNPPAIQSIAFKKVLTENNEFANDKPTRSSPIIIFFIKFIL
jgi:hypothetical protein